MLDPQHLTTPKASTAYYKGRFTFFSFHTSHETQTELHVSQRNVETHVTKECGTKYSVNLMAMNNLKVKCFYFASILRQERKIFYDYYSTTYCIVNFA
jgi:hypothetical protein